METGNAAAHGSILARMTMQRFDYPWYIWVKALNFHQCQQWTQRCSVICSGLFLGQTAFWFWRGQFWTDGLRRFEKILLISCTGQLIKLYSSIKMWLQILKYLNWFWQSEGWMYGKMSHKIWVIPGIFINNLTAYLTNVDQKPGIRKTAEPPSDTARFIRLSTNRTK